LRELYLEAMPGGAKSERRKMMYARSLGLIIILAISLIVANAAAENQNVNKKFDDVQATDHSNGSIVIISREESDVPGYVHMKYAFIDQSCGAILVDRFGPAINPSDRELKQIEQRMCTEIATNSRDGD
jgi:hypothetical protein